MVQLHVKKVEKSILAPRPTRFLPTGLRHGHGVTRVLHGCREKETIVIESCIGTKGGTVVLPDFCPLACSLGHGVTRVLHGCHEKETIVIESCIDTKGGTVVMRV